MADIIQQCCVARFDMLLQILSFSYWLVYLFFFLFGRTALIGGVKESECEVQVSDMLLPRQYG